MLLGYYEEEVLKHHYNTIITGKQAQYRSTDSIGSYLVMTTASYGIVLHFILFCCCISSTALETRNCIQCNVADNTENECQVFMFGQCLVSNPDMTYQ